MRGSTASSRSSTANTSSRCARTACAAAALFYFIPSLTRALALLLQHLDEEKPEGAENEAVEQVAFADRLILNKTDLVPDESEVSRIETKLREVNKYAPILRCTMSNVSMENVLNIRAFELSRVLEMDPEFLTEGDHQHDSTVYSVGFERAGDLNMERTNTWIAKLLQEKGVDIYRMKGVLSMTGCAERYVYQGVHMLFTGEVLTPWGDAPRVNRLIFIGKNLDRAALEKGFESCLENPPPA